MPMPERPPLSPRDVWGAPLEAALDWVEEVAENASAATDASLASFVEDPASQTRAAIEAIAGGGGTPVQDPRLALAAYQAQAGKSWRLEQPFNRKTVMAKPPTVTLVGSGDISAHTLVPLLRTVTVTAVNGSADVTATAGTFSAADVGKTFGSTASGVGGGGTIAAVTDATHATLAAAATVSGTIRLVFSEESGHFTRLGAVPLVRVNATGIAGTAALVPQQHDGLLMDRGAVGVGMEFTNLSKIGFYGFSHITTANYVRVLLDTGFGYEDVSPSGPIKLNATASPTGFVLDFGQKIPKARVRFEWSAATSPGQLGVLVPTADVTAGGTYGPEPIPAAPVKAAWLADSYVEGGFGGATGSRGAWDTPATSASSLLGHTHIFNRGQGGTGWLNNGSSNNSNYRTARDRLAELYVLRPDVLVIALGQNDQGSTETAIRDEAAYVLGQIATNLPRTRLYVIGPWGSPTLPLGHVTAALKSACAAAGVVFADPRSGAMYDKAGAQVNTATATPWMVEGDWTPDNVHATRAAGQKLGEYAAQFIALFESPLRTVAPA